MSGARQLGVDAEHCLFVGDGGGGELETYWRAVAHTGERLAVPILALRAPTDGRVEDLSGRREDSYSKAT